MCSLHKGETREHHHEEHSQIRRQGQLAARVYPSQATRREETRDETKLSASFAAELCHRGLVSIEEKSGIMEGFGRGHVEVEVLCALLTKLHPLKTLNMSRSLAQLVAMQESMRESSNRCDLIHSAEH